MYWPTIEIIGNSSAFNILWVDSLLSETRIPTAILICYNFLLNINHAIVNGHHGIFFYVHGIWRVN